VRLHPGAVLEDLDADDQLIKGVPGQRGQIAGDQLAGPVRPPGPQLRGGLRGNVQSGEVESGVQQGEQVTPVAAADVDPVPEPAQPGCGDDVVHEVHGRVACVAAGRVLRVPGSRLPGGHGAVRAKAVSSEGLPGNSLAWTGPRTSQPGLFTWREAGAAASAPQ
jgi:hypothetical protein